MEKPNCNCTQEPTSVRKNEWTSERLNEKEKEANISANKQRKMQIIIAMENIFVFFLEIHSHRKK